MSERDGKTKKERSGVEWRGEERRVEEEEEEEEEMRGMEKSGERERDPKREKH